MRSGITRVRLQNYKSIASCDVALGPLTFLVGPNGAGKSNFLDALRFVKDTLNDDLTKAISSRGGFSSLRKLPKAGFDPVGIRIGFVTQDQHAGHYSFQLGGSSGGIKVLQEECVVIGSKRHEYRLSAGKLEITAPMYPPIALHRIVCTYRMRPGFPLSGLCMHWRPGWRSIIQFPRTYVR